MEMKKSLFDEIIHSSSGFGYETGGFVGVCGNKICVWAFDEGVRGAREGVYCPNKNKFYFMISSWREIGVTCLGIVHTHLNGNPQLSQGDVRYINSIFDRNGNLVKMFFPIVIPDKEIHVYGSRRKDGEVLIQLVPLKIIMYSRSLFVPDFVR